MKDRDVYIEIDGLIVYAMTDIMKEGIERQTYRYIYIYVY